MLTPTTLSKPMAVAAAVRITINGRTSSAMPNVAPPTLNNVISMAISQNSRPLNRLISFPRPALIAPLFCTT